VRRLLIVLVVFAATRGVAGYVAHHPEVYPDGSGDASSDVGIYQAWARQVQDEGLVPYRDFRVEYPPGSVAVADVPYRVTHEHYRVAFIVQSVALDALGLVAMCRLARRRRSWWGVVAWLALLPLLGPVAYTRLDMAVAACIAWALERVEARRWSAAGAWLGLGTAIKLTPGLLLPAIVLAAPKRWRPALAAVAVGGLFVLPFLRDLPDLYDQVAGYHLDRGVHAESLWGSLALSARVVFGMTAEVLPAFGAEDVLTPFDDSLKLLSNIAALGVLVDSLLAATRRVRRGDGAHVVLVVAGALTLLTAVGRVFSPQYLVWLVAVMAAALAVAPRALRWAALLLTVAVGLAHLVYPVWFSDYLNVEGWAVGVGVVRNLAMLGAGLLTVRVAWRYGRSGLPALEQHEVVEVAEADVLVGPHGQEGPEGDRRGESDHDGDGAPGPQP
jgi:hypothetical protein